MHSIAKGLSHFHMSKICSRKGELNLVNSLTILYYQHISLCNTWPIYICCVQTSSNLWLSRASPPSDTLTCIFFPSLMRTDTLSRIFATFKESRFFCVFLLAILYIKLIFGQGGLHILPEKKI